MLSFGQRACAEYSKSGLSSDEKLAMTYYDASRVYYQIADYTGDSSWTSCESKAEAIYKSYVTESGGGVPGYWNFTTGFLMDVQHTSDATSKQAAISLSQNGRFLRRRHASRMDRRPVSEP